MAKLFYLYFLTHQIPIESSAQVSWRSNILKRVHTDHIDYRTHNPRRILGHPFEQWLQPILVALAVTVQEGEDIGSCDFGTIYTRSHETFAFLVANDFDFVDFGQF